MQRAIKLPVNVGKDRVVKLPSEFPESPAEVAVIAAQTVPDAGGAPRGDRAVRGAYIADDLDAPLPLLPR